MIAGAALIIGGVMFMEGVRRSPQTPYFMIFDYSVLGLNVGAMVEYKGVPVGQVTNIQVTKDNNARVDIIVNDDTVTLHAGVTATATLQSFVTGVLIISLEGGDRTKSQLSPKQQIPTSESLTAELLSSVTNVQDNITRIASRLSEALEGMEEGDITRIVHNVEELTEQAVTTLDDVSVVVDETSETITIVRDRAIDAVDAFEETAVSLQETSDSVNALVNDIRNQVAEMDIAAREEDLANVLKAVEKSAESIAKMADTLSGTVESTQYDVDNMEHMLRETLRAVNQTLSSMRALTEELREDPASVIRGPSRRQED